MSQKKAAEIIDHNASRDAAAGQSRFEKAGEFLASTRQAAGLDLAAISAGTKVKIEHLEAIEQTRPDKLPATPYAVGFVKVYARFLDLDADAVAAQFKDDIGAAAPAPVELAPLPASPEAMREVSEGVRMVSIFGIIAILIFAGWAGFGIIGNKDAAIEEFQPALEERVTSAPRLAPPIETAPQTTDKIALPSLEESVESEIVETAPDEAQEIVIADTPTAADEPALVLNAGAGAPSPSISPLPETAPELTPVILPRRDPPAARSVIVASEVTRSPAPKYPDHCSRDAAAVETVTVLFDVTDAGRTTNARPLSSTNACFENSALRTIKRWRFSPKTVDGAARPDAGKVATLNFRK